MTDIAPTGEAPSVDQVVAARLARATEPETATPEAAEAPEPAAEAPAEGGEQEISGDQTPEAEGAAGEDPPTAEGDEGTEAEADPEGEPIEPPSYWTPEDKAQFANLTRRGQELILTYEQQRAGMLRSAVDRATAAQKAAEAEIVSTRALKARFDEILPQAEQVYLTRWQDVDLLKIAREEGDEVAEQVKAQWQTEHNALQQLQASTKEAEEAWFKAHMAEEQPKLLQRIPELADPNKGRAILGEINSLLETEGYTAEEIRLASAKDLRIAYEAAQWRKLQKSLAGKPKPQLAPPQRAQAKPAAASASVVTNSQREIAALEKRFNETRDPDDLTKLRLARKKAG